MITCGVARLVVSHRRGEHHIQPLGLGTALDLVAPIGMNLAGKINVKGHGASESKRPDHTRGGGKGKMAIRLKAHSCLGPIPPLPLTVLNFSVPFSTGCPTRSRQYSSDVYTSKREE